jgi:hypothetical protein
MNCPVGNRQCEHLHCSDAGMSLDRIISCRTPANFQTVRMLSATHQERRFNRDGLPITTPTNHATVPMYPRPECGGE